MRSNSPRRSPSTRATSSTIAPTSWRKLLGPCRMGEPVKDAIHHLRLLLGEKGMRDVHIFGDHDAGRDVAANEELIGSGAEDGAQDRIDAGKPPALGELLVDQRVDAELLAHH